MIRSLLAAFAALSITMCLPAGLQGQVAAGTWDLEIAFGGGILEGRLEISAPRRDSLDVKIFVGDHQSPIRLTRREGNRLILDSTVPGMQVHYELDLRGDAVTGQFTYDGNTGTVTGRRRA